MIVPSVARGLQRSGLAALLLLLPFSKAAVEISFGLLLVGWVLERLHPATRSDTIWRLPRLRPLGWAIGAYLAVCALSILVSDVPSLSVRGVVRKWLEYLWLFVMATDLGARRAVAHRAVALVACSSFGVVLWAIGEELYAMWLRLAASGGWFTSDPTFVYGRMTGPYENPIDLATYLMVVIPLLVGMVRCHAGRRRSILWLLLALATACVVRSASKGAWVSLGLGLLAMGAIWVGIRRVLLPLVGGLLLVGAMLWGGVWHLALPLASAGATDRWAMWQAALGMIRDRPLLGHGVNTFMANYLHYWVGGERLPRYAHSCYLQVAAETGMLGLVSFLGVLGLIFHRVLSGIRRAAGCDKPVLIGFLGGLLAFVTQAGVDTNFYSLRQAALFWVLAGLATGLSEQGERVRSPAAPASAR